MTIKLSHIMDNKSYPEAGDALFNILAGNHSEDKINIDLEGVVALPSIFLNVSIGRYIQEHGINKLRATVSFSKISATQAKRLTEYIQRISNA